MSQKKESAISSPDWFYDRYVAREVEAKRYLIIAIVLGVLLIVISIALIMLFPLKKTIMEPYVIFIDNITGVTSTLTQASAMEFSQHTPVVKYFLARYVRIREGYNNSNIYAQKSTIKAFTSADTYKYFESELSAKQEENKNPGRILVDILSVTFPFKNIAHVRYTKLLENNMKSTWLATLEIDQMEEIDEALAETNPLGLVVMNYETIKEADYGTIN